MFAWQKRFAEEQEPEALTLYLLEKYPPIHPDAKDTDLLDTCCGATVTFMHSGCPGVSARKQVSGIVKDVTTDKWGDRHLLVKVEGRPFAEWVNVNRVQFPGKNKTLTSASVAKISVS